MKISLIVASRGRPDRYVEMASSAQKLADRPGLLEFVLGVDDDDPTARRYPWHITTQRAPVPALYESLARRASGELLMFASDDIVFRTPGWDEIVRHQFMAVPDRLLLAYTNDGRNREKVEHFIVSREWVAALGWFQWAGDCHGLGPFEHFCCDEMLERIARGAGRLRFLRDLVTEHRHAKYGKAESDATYQAKRGAGQDGTTMSDRDNRRLAAMQPEIDNGIARILGAIAQHAAARGGQQVGA